ncbi:hypothetical protein [Saccharothrix sp. HUAS TT1]|uniref:hypothetical protein n=1 Tax=unclassified Saccharothrix TaxID=2593673 RepID=UPI00345C2180
MTAVEIDLRNAGLGPATPRVLTFVPTRRLTAPSHVVLPEPMRVALANGKATVQLAATNGGTYAGLWAWRVTEYGPLARHVRTVLVPNSATPLAYSALVDVDPATLAPEVPPPAAWWGEIADLRAQLAALDGVSPEEVEAAVEAWLAANPLAGEPGPAGPAGPAGPEGPAGPAGSVPTNAMLAWRWGGSAYVASTSAGHYVGPVDPGNVPDGSIWDDTSA